ncbi:MAG: hypothetical protein WBE40_03170 [Thermoplasmata archaeon]
MSASMRRSGTSAAVLWAVVAVLVVLGVVSSYSMVGFTSMSQFAKYLFRVTPSPGALSHVPGLYDLLLGVYLLAIVVGAFAIPRKSTPAPAGTAAS